MPDLQAYLKSEVVYLVPLKETDFDLLYKVASDPLIWEQHPNKNRYQKDVFKTFFDGALESKGAYLVYDSATGELIGSSRFYDWNEDLKQVLIGYTFLSRDHWGTTYNRALKTIMLDHAFTFAERVHFHIGECNIRSQKAIEKLGAVKIGMKPVAYHGEKDAMNCIYEIARSSWKR